MMYLMKEDGRSEERVIEFVSILWAIWMVKNSIIFRNRKYSPTEIMIIQKEWRDRELKRRKMRDKNGTKEEISRKEIYWEMGNKENIRHTIVK